MSKIIGIDLGTTTSEIAYLRNGKPEIIISQEGDRIIPSVIGINRDQVLIFGKKAKRQLTLRPRETVQEVKRQMGSTEKVMMGERDYYPQELSAMLLKYLKKCAEEYLGEKVTEAVITVPAMFDNMQRQATKDAAEIAGLKVERIINEPTAAALAYGLENLNKDEKVLVYDLGGGTFDVSILEMYDGVLDVQVSRGCNTLGGKDFDERLMEYIFEEFYRLHEIDLRNRDEAKHLIKDAAENAKIELSNQGTTDIDIPSIPSIMHSDGSPIAIDMRIFRKQFEVIISDLVQITEDIINEALIAKGLKEDDINVVLLVGGSTRVPCVRRMLARKFGNKVRTDINPDEVVALGAAIQAGIKSGAFDSQSEILITDICPYSLGISTVTNIGGRLMSGINDVLIPIDTTIPYSYKKKYLTVSDNQTSVLIEVYQGEDVLVLNNIKVGEFRLGGIPESDAGEQSIEITFTYDINGILQVDAIVLSTGMKTSQVFNIKSMDLEEIDTAKSNLDELWKNSAFAGKSKAVIEVAVKRMEKLNPTEKAGVQNILEKLKQSLLVDDELLIEKYDTELTDLLFNLD